jgi:glycosyltransferase involved in cell wall biosynthesis
MQVPVPPDRSSPGTILLVTEPGVDGVFHYVKNLADFLLADGWRVHLGYSSQRSCPALFELVARVEAAGGRTTDLRVGNAPRPGDARAIARLRALAQATKPEVIHAHSSKAGALARMLPLLGVQARYFYTPHAYFQMNTQLTPRKLLYSAIEHVFGWIGTTLNVSRSETEYAHQVLRLPVRKLRLTLGGVDCDRFHPPGDAGERREARARFGLPQDVPLLGTVARYSAQKDPLTLYAALVQIMTRHPAMCFAQLGKGELSGAVDVELSAAPPDVRARIFRIEASNEPAVFYRALDGYVLASLYEGFSLSMLEAMATGLPLILSRCPGNTDVADLALSELRWSAPGDVVSLARQIDDWASIPARPNNHRETAVSQFNLPDRMGAFPRLYRERSNEATRTHLTRDGKKSA